MTLPSIQRIGKVERQAQLNSGEPFQEEGDSISPIISISFTNFPQQKRRIAGFSQGYILLNSVLPGH